MRLWISSLKSFASWMLIFHGSSTHLSVVSRSIFQHITSQTNSSNLSLCLSSIWCCITWQHDASHILNNIKMTNIINSNKFITVLYTANTCRTIVIFNCIDNKIHSRLLSISLNCSTFKMLASWDGGFYPF